MTASGRAARVARADGACRQAFTAARCPEQAVALVAVGGYGRGDLAPHSDLDLVLVHDDVVPVGAWAADLWYPLWDSGAPIDHAVRSLPQVLEQCTVDLRVAMGMLHARHLAGDPNLTLRLRTQVLTQWRRDARNRLAELHELVRVRGSRSGELAHEAVPDLKEASGGLRDTTVLDALVATWLVDVPHNELRLARRQLLDVRDALHEVSGRATNRVAPEYWSEMATLLGSGSAVELQRHTRALGRRVMHISTLTWARAEAVRRRPPAGAPRRPRLEAIAPGLAVQYGEVVLAAGARPEQDPGLLLRAAAEAAERRLVLPPSTLRRLAQDAPVLPDSWPAGAQDLVRLLAAGTGLRAVWETLEETGAVERFLPEWEHVRLLPHASPIHRFTVDRHMVETCVEASRLVRRVSRPDLLVLAALLHDIGKGRPVAHSLAGAPIAREVALRIGFGEPDAARVAALVRHHLLLPESATRRDLHDPATARQVAERVGDTLQLELLAALTEADARATSNQAWTTWRRGLVGTLVEQVRALLEADAVAPEDRPPATASPSAPVDGSFPESVREHGWDFEKTYEGLGRLWCALPDRFGLLADVAATLSGLRVHALHAWTEGTTACSVWDLGTEEVDLRLLRQRLAVLQAGPGPAPYRQPLEPDALAPVVRVRFDASTSATVLEVRTQDRAGVLRAACAALVRLGLTVRSVHADTVGPQAVDVFYVQEHTTEALTDQRAAEAAHVLRAVLGRGEEPASRPSATGGAAGAL